MLNSLQQHRASLALWDAHSARFPIRATIVPALDHEERREILSMKMPRLPSSVGGALFLCLWKTSLLLRHDRIRPLLHDWTALLKEVGALISAQNLVAVDVGERTLCESFMYEVLFTPVSES